MALIGAGCADATDATDGARATAPVSSSPMSTPSTPSGDPAREEDQMRIQITFNEQRFGTTLVDSAAARDLIAKLPVTIDMIDHNRVEKTGPLPAPLSLEGQPEGADPVVGDLGYYVPGNDLVLYYGDQSSFPGIVILGRLDHDLTQLLSDLEGPVTATVRVAR